MEREIEAAKAERQRDEAIKNARVASILEAAALEGRQKLSPETTEVTTSMKITVDENGHPLDMVGRKHLTLDAGSSMSYIGWEPETVATDGPNQGLPWSQANTTRPPGEDLDLQGTLRLVTPEGETATVNFTQRN